MRFLRTTSRIMVALLIVLVVILLSAAFLPDVHSKATKGISSIAYLLSSAQNTESRVPIVDDSVVLSDFLKSLVSQAQASTEAPTDAPGNPGGIPQRVPSVIDIASGGSSRPLTQNGSPQRSSVSEAQLGALIDSIAESYATIFSWTTNILPQAPESPFADFRRMAPFTAPESPPTRPGGARLPIPSSVSETQLKSLIDSLTEFYDILFPSSFDAEAKQMPTHSPLFHSGDAALESVAEAKSDVGTESDVSCTSSAAKGASSKWRTQLPCRCEPDSEISEEDRAGVLLFCSANNSVGVVVRTPVGPPTTPGGPHHVPPQSHHPADAEVESVAEAKSDVGTESDVLFRIPSSAAKGVSSEWRTQLLCRCEPDAEISEEDRAGVLLFCFANNAVGVVERTPVGPPTTSNGPHGHVPPQSDQPADAEVESIAEAKSDVGTESDVFILSSAAKGVASEGHTQLLCRCDASLLLAGTETQIKWHCTKDSRIGIDISETPTGPNNFPPGTPPP